MPAAAAAAPFLTKLGTSAGLGNLGLALTIGGTLFQGISAFAASRANAKVLKQRSVFALQRGQLAKKQSLREGEETLGQALADFSVAGVDLNSGTVLSVLGEIAADAALDAELALFEGQLESSNLQFEADSQKRQGTSKLVGSVLGAGGTLATSLAKKQTTDSTGKPLTSVPDIMP